MKKNNRRMPLVSSPRREAVESYQACLISYGVTESYDLPEGVYEREILPIAPLLHGVKEAFAHPNTGMAPTIMGGLIVATLLTLGILPVVYSIFYNIHEKR